MRDFIVISIVFLLFCCKLQFVSQIEGEWKSDNIGDTYYILEVINDESLEENFQLIKFKGEENILTSTGKIEIEENLLLMHFKESNKKKIFTTDLSLNRLELDLDGEKMIFNKQKKANGGKK